MFTIGDECIACCRAHPGAHDRTCLTDSSDPYIQRGTAPVPGVERWWLSTSPDPDGREIFCTHLTGVMQQVRWQAFRGMCDADITLLSMILQGHGWCLAAWAGPTRPRSLAPYELIAITHVNRREDRTRTIWLLGDTRSEEAEAIAVDLATVHTGHPVPLPALGA